MLAHHPMAIARVANKHDARRSRPRQKAQRGRTWSRLPRERLLETRLCDLGVGIDGSWLEEPIARVYEELAARGIRSKPHFWLSEEWFSPAGIPGVAIPFYLAHPRLMRLERSQMLQVEGGARDECLMLLRHEVGHAIDHAYDLRLRRRWQQVFGKSSEPYPDWYRPNPASRRYVQHLPSWYAQAHPDEDFAETFAVWLKPRSNWRARYRGWPALKKLEYVDEIMAEIAGRPPKVRSRARPDELSRIRKTLRAYYRQKQERYTVGFTDLYDRDLLRLFSADPGRGGRPSAATFLRRHRTEIRELVANWTGEYQFTLDQVLHEMIGRCRQLKLHTVGPERRVVLDFAILLTVHTMHYLYRVRDWRPL